MIDMTAWMNAFLTACNERFGQRVWFVGLQGSYARGEATESSDIDIVMILDALSAEDLLVYRAMLDTLPHREKICGFLAGKTELFNWDPADLFQFYYDTKPVTGSLDELRPLINDEAVERAIRMGMCSLYHGCVHNMLHEKSGDILRSLYKSAVFTVQAICFRQTGRYISRQRDLLTAVLPDERMIVDTAFKLKCGGEIDFEEMSAVLFRWTQAWINKQCNKKDGIE